MALTSRSPASGAFLDSSISFVTSWKLLLIAAAPDSIVGTDTDNWGRLDEPGQPLGANTNFERRVRREAGLQ